MKIKTKEELKNALFELRKGKDKQENYYSDFIYVCLKVLKDIRFNWDFLSVLL